MELTTRKNWIDWAKAFGILLVVMGHSNYNITNVNSMIFMVHMPLFFFASGYLFNTNKSLKELTHSNVYGLLVPFILYNFISLVYICISSFIKVKIGIDVDWRSLIIQPLFNTLLGFPGNMLCGPTWFLLALLWCKYIVYGIERSRPYMGFFIFFLWSISLITIQFVKIDFPLSFNGGVSGCLWFLIGYLIKKYSIRLHVGKLHIFFLIIISYIVCMYICIINGNCNYLSGNLNGLLGVIGTATGLICIFGICILLDNIQLTLIVHISRASIVIMCLHLIIMPNLEKLTHYQNHLGITLLGDIFIVIILTAFYPFIKKYTPFLVGYRK